MARGIFIRTEEYRRKISMAGKGHITSIETRKKIGDKHRGKIVSDESKKKNSEAHKKIWETMDMTERNKKISKAHKGRIKTKEHLANIGRALKGRTFSEETKEKMSKGQLGKKLSRETKQKLSDSMIGRMPQNLQIAGQWGNIKRGWFDVNGKRMFFRSTWEVNYALYLDFLITQKQIKSWEYEVDTFWFENIKRGVRSYLPDFKVFNNNGTFEYHEVKGYMDPKSVTKLKRMAKYHPSVKMVLIGKDEYKELKQKIGRMAGFYE